MVDLHAPQQRSEAVVVGRPPGALRVRVRTLLNNPALGRTLRGRWPGTLQVRLSTGTVIARLDDGRSEAIWLDELGAIVRAGADRQPLRPNRRVGTATGIKRRRPEASAPGPACAWPHAATLATVAREIGCLGTPAEWRAGSSSAQAQARLAADGPNVIPDVAARSAMDILRGQFTSVPVALLGASAVLSLATRAYVDAAAIGTVLAANGGIGFITERDAEATVTSLRRLQPHRATVLRDGEPTVVDAREVVVGDVLLLQPGEAVAADARVIEAHRLATNEAALTGESLPVRKAPVVRLPAATPVSERRNMVFLGTVVSGGIGRALVVATGEHTELGRIQALAQTTRAPSTRLQDELDTLGRRLGLGAGGLCLALLGLGLLRGRAVVPLLRTVVSLAVAAIPEGLPAVATSLLASSVRDLQKRQIFVRRLQAVENLGAVDTVCLDKTGTLTQNKMSVASLSIGLKSFEPADPAVASLPDDWMKVSVLCNSVEREDHSRGDSSSWSGSSTELALLEFAAGRGADARQLRETSPTLGIRHRSEHHPYMVTMHEQGRSGMFIAVKGRPDEVLKRCSRWFDGRATMQLDRIQRTALLALNDDMAGHGQRVLALACKAQRSRRFGETADLTWLGMAGLADPLRPGLPQMLQRFRAAGIRPLMITGDQPATAQAVAEQIGLDGDRPLADAAELPESTAAIAERVDGISGFARTSPAMKLKIVHALQRGGHVVAMTGDGINDGPALKAADVGLAMGISGTDFAHAMSDVVLKDDHPGALLAAIERGRTAFVNVRKSVRYLVATNLSELTATSLAVALGLPEPLDPLALLWTNIATDIWPAIALGMEPTEPGLMERPPVSLHEGLLNRTEWQGVAIEAGSMTLVALASFGYGLARYGNGQRAKTLAFNALTTSQLLFALSMRSSRPLRSGGMPPNPMLRRAVTWSLLAQAGTVLLPPLRRLLRTTPISWSDAVLVVSTAALPLMAREMLKQRQVHRG